MTRWHSACWAFLFLFPAAPALGWGDDGHMLVGSIADKLLEGHPAKDKVKAILGFKLRDAAVWADCVRGVKRQPDGKFAFQPDPAHPEYIANCGSFMTDAEKPRMEDYARRNWTTCFHINEQHGCHETYHYADVPVQRDSYHRDHAGTSEHDVVSAINAAIAVLKGEKPAPFWIPDRPNNPYKPNRKEPLIKDKKEALFLLAHFVGDLHQPLHIGSVYLDESGNLIDPKTPKQEEDGLTNGGNALLFDSGKKLHVIWDDVANGLGDRADAATVAAARSVPPTPGDVSDWAAAWATESLLAAQTAFAGLTFTKRDSHQWTVHFADRPAYFAMVDKTQRERVIMGGARLAELLKAILK